MKKKKSALFSALKFIFPLVSLAVIFFGGIFLLRSLFAGFLLSFSISVPETPSVPRESVSIAEGPRPSASTANGSFTELFSGAGWMNKEKTDVYQDDKLSSISFPPDYEWREVPALSDSIKDETIYGEQDRTIIAANGNGREIVLVAKSGKIMSLRGAAGDEAISSSQSSIIGNQLRNALLDYDDAKQTWIIAASSDNADFIGPIGHISPIGQIGPISDLVCANGECLLLSGPKIYRFSESNPSSVIEIEPPLEVQSPNIENPRESASMLSLGKAGNILLVGAVEKNGSTSLTTRDGIYSGSIYKYSAGSLSIINNQSLFSSPYPGTIRFGYDKENSEILALYAAYIGQAYLLRVNPLLDSVVPRSSASIIDDFSRFFPQRVMDGNGTPKIFKYGNAWWLSSEVNKPVVSGVEPSSPKFVRIEGGAGIDFADTLLRGQQLVVSGVEPAFELLPGFSANELYALAAGQDGAKIYKFIDKGYKKDKKLVWESLRLNRFDNEIVSGRFYKIQGSEDNIRVNPLLNESNPRSSASILYYLSNDGGKNWQETKLNEKIDFQTKGNDFRFKTELYPGADVSQTPRESASTAKTIRVNPPLNFQTPWLNLISVEYYSTPNP